jgi:type IV pilus assembly protein PilA
MRNQGVKTMDTSAIRTKAQRGFSLVELMVVVAIISILSAIAIPKFKTFQAKARQAEAKSNLANIFTLELAYQAEADTFVALTSAQACGTSSPNPLGFYLTNCTTARYTYTVGGVTTAAFLGDAISGTGTANKIVPGCATADHWTIDQNKNIVAVANAVALCP